MSVLAETVNAPWVDLYNAGFGETGFDREFEEVFVKLR